MKILRSLTGVLFLILSLSMLCTGCTGAYHQDEPYYSAIPSTNNPNVTRHPVRWEPGAKY